VFPDFVEFIASLNGHRVRYLLIGGYAVAFHARPRATKDVDVWIDRTPANAKRAQTAIAEFLGEKPASITLEKLLDERTVLILGRSPVRIDVLTSLEGLAFRDAWKGRVQATFGAQPAPYIGLDHLILVKEIAGRPVDREDVRVLKSVRARNASKPKRRGGASR
jgi:hypothetical protein